MRLGTSAARESVNLDGTARRMGPVGRESAYLDRALTRRNGIVGEAMAENVEGRTLLREVALERRLQELLSRGRALMIATAESCTGGGVAQRITSIPGSSVYFRGGIVAYANEVKLELLGVTQTILEHEGAVSEACARAMAEGARTALGADITVSTTGVAGPGGGSTRKPVGLVYVAVARRAETTVRERRFAGDRATVVGAAIDAALEMLVAAVEETLACRGAQ